MCFDRLIHVLELFMSLFKDRLKAFEKFKNKKKKCMKQSFLVCKNMVIPKVYSIYHTLR